MYGGGPFTIGKDPEVLALILVSATLARSSDCQHRHIEGE